MNQSEFPFFLRHFWLLLIAAPITNALIYRPKLLARFPKDPKLRTSVNRLVLGFCFWGSLPWLFMGFGIETGQVASPFDFFWSAPINHFVQAWFGFMVALFALGTLWIFLGGGAGSLSEVISEFNPLFTPKVVRWVWVGGVLWNLAIGSAMYFDIMGFGRGRIAGRIEPVESLDMAYFPLFFLAMWTGISFLLSFVGGWWLLGKEYRAVASFEGRRFRFCTGNMGGVAMGNCLTLGVGKDGFYLATLFPFRLGHPPLLIPWNEVEISEEKTFWIKQVVFRFKRSPKIRFAISRRLALKLKEELWATEALKNLT